MIHDLTSLILRRRFIIACFWIMPMFSAWGSSADIAVSIHGVNYSDQEFGYVLRDPVNPSNEGGGESIDRFAAGGTMCCFSLPRKWKPGIKINIDYYYYLPETPDGKLPKIIKTSVVDVPRYVTPEDLWVLRNEDGSMSALSSKYQPDHPNWPGKIKGWPVPSLAYKRERWGIYMKHEMDGVELYEGLLKDLRLNPDKEAKDAWDFQIKRERDLKLRFKGASDPSYLEYLKRSYENSLVRSRGLVQRLTESKP